MMSFFNKKWLDAGVLHTTASDERVPVEAPVYRVIAAGRKFKVLHTNSLAEDDMAMSCPAIAGDRLLIRTAARVYCIRKAR